MLKKQLKSLGSIVVFHIYIFLMEKIYYTIKLHVKTDRDIKNLHCHWNGQAFTRCGEPWAIINDETIARAEFQKALLTLKPEYWGGRYKIRLMREIYDYSDNLKESCVMEVQTDTY